MFHLCKLWHAFVSCEASYSYNFYDMYIYIFTLYRIDIDITVNSVISRLFMLVSLFDLSRLLVSSCLVPALLDMHAEDYSKENAPLRLWKKRRQYGKQSKRKKTGSVLLLHRTLFIQLFANQLLCKLPWNDNRSGAVSRCQILLWSNFSCKEPAVLESGRVKMQI